MATDKKTSTLVQSQLPQYLLEEGPNLVAFLKAYYEWMETSGQATDASKNILANRDIDTADLNKFYEYFRREVIPLFPKTMMADKRLVAKKIKDLYLSKGTRKSYQLLFRILYNEDVTVYNPSDNILRVSDGRWRKDTLLRLGQPFAGNINDIDGKTVTGQSSGATGRVLEQVTVFESGVEVRELRITEVKGTFLDLETVSTSGGISGVIINSTGPLASVSIGAAGTSGGTGHRLGDLVNLNSAKGTGAKGTVTKTSDEVVTFKITDGGSGFTVGSSVITVSGGSPSSNAVIGSATVTAISNTETISGFADIISDLKDTPINHGPTYSSNSGPISSNLASSNSSTAMSAALGRLNLTAGTISSLSVTEGNYVVNLPNVKVIDTVVSSLELPDGSGGIKGKNATISAQFAPGSIAEVEVTSGGSAYNAVSPITLVNTTRTAVNGIGSPAVSGVVSDIGGYTDTKGFLSWDQRLRDNYYYQEYSYQLRSDKTLKAYRNIVQEVLHPAGTKLFGQVEISHTVDLTGLAVEQFLSLDLIGGKNGVPGIPSTASFGTPDITITAVIPSIDQTVISTDTRIDRDLFANTVGVGTVVPAPTAEFNPTPPSIESTLVFGTSLLSGQIPLGASVLSSETFSTDGKVMLHGGFVYVSNNNVISHYLTKPITHYVSDPVTLGTGIVLHGDGANNFPEIVKGGSIIEIEDRVPGNTGNTTYIVNTVYSNTTLTMNASIAANTIANGVIKFFYDGNL